MFLAKELDSKEKTSVKFVMAVLRQHEIELDRLISSFELLLSRIDELSDKLEYYVDKASH